MNKLTNGFLIGAMVACMVSCSSDDGIESLSGEKGSISLSLSTDGRVMNMTRADDGMSPIVPDVATFGIGLHKNDGSYSKTWDTLDHFHSEHEFPIGDYDIEASYGDIEQEGFEHPYYYGVNQVHVGPNAKTDVAVVATLANSMVSFRYTDAFKNYFTAYNGAVQTPGHQYVTFSQEEERPAYIKPSEVNVTLSLTNGQGKTVTIQPAGFTAEPRHHYVVTFNVNADAQGNMALDVQFDDNVVSETVDVSLGDQLWNSPAPTVTPQGFTSGQENKAFEYAHYSNEAKFAVFALGGLTSANLNIVSSAQYVPAFGERIDLMKASELQQQQLEESGLGCYGFYRNPDKLAVLDLEGFIGNLPVGRHTISLQVKDAQTRLSDEIQFVVEITPVTVEIKAPRTASFLATEATVDVYTDCIDIRNELSFEAPDENNRMVQADVIRSQVISVPAGSQLPYAIRYVLEVSPLNNPIIDVRAMLGTKTFDVNVPVAEPDYTLDIDAYATKAEIKINSADQKVIDYVISNTKVYNGENILTREIVNDTERGMFIVTGLSPSTTYSDLKFTVTGFDKNVPEFTTEAKADVPNGDFQNLVNTINFSHIDTGGAWKYGLYKAYVNYTSIYVNEPADWCSVNAKTCYEDANTLNTWFVVPSTMASNGEVTLRSVAYDHNGVMPPQDNHGLSVISRCSRNAPENIASRAAGELFLGKYIYNGTETRENGIAFTSRPSTISFEYLANPINGEHGAVEVTVYGDNDEKLSTTGVYSLTVSGQWESKEIQLPQYPFGKKAKKLYVRFVSSAAEPVEVHIPTGNELDDVNTPTGENRTHQIATNEYKALATGSELKIKNVHLGYEVSSLTGKSTRNNKKK